MSDDIEELEHGKRTERRKCTIPISKWRAIITVIFVICNCINLTVCNILISEKFNEQDMTILTSADIATKLLKNMNKNVNPCEDFYEFACGGFINSSVIPADENFISVPSIVKKEIQKQLKVILQEPILSNESKPFQLAKNYYKTCMNQTAIEQQGLEPLKKIIKQLGGWPVVDGDKWNQSQFDPIEATLQFYDMGYPIDYFLDIYIDIYQKNATSRVIYMTSTTEEGSLSDENSFLKITMDFGADYQSASIQFKEIIKFRNRLFQINDTPFFPPNLIDEINNADQFKVTKNLRNSFVGIDSNSNLYYLRNISEISERYPSIPWKKYINHLLSPKTQIDDNELLNVANLDGIEYMENLLKNTDKRTIANYMIWKAVTYSSKFLNENIRNMSEYHQTDRWKECVDEVSESLPISLSALYIRKHFDKESKKKVEEIVTDINNKLYQILANVSWMDEETKKNALEKSKFMLNHIAYPDELLDDSKLEEYYKELDFSEESYLEKHLKIIVFHKKKIFSLLKEPVRRKLDWFTQGSSIEVNAFYIPQRNIIEIPAGYLQGLHFNKNWPNYVNYGAIGKIIGHEITHGYDSISKEFGKDGTLENLWTFETSESYNEKAQCFINQYENYSTQYAYRELDGNRTLAENIADNGGLKIAYLAYLDWSKRNGEEEKLPNIDWSPKQMFWITAANSKCSVYKKEASMHLMTVDSHSPDELRILGPFSNMPEFAEDFNCPIGSRMNPVKKCSFW